MCLKESNEITLKIKCELNEFYKIVEKKGFKIIDKFSMDDTYFIPEEVELDKVNTRDILSKAVLVRDIIGKMSNRRTKLITFKIKNFDESGNILNQESVNCNILETEDAKKLLKAIGYKEIMDIKEDDVVYEKNGFQLAIKDIKNGDNLIEIETEENKELDTIEKLIRKVNKIGIPVYTDNYFVKKAEIELDKDSPIPSNAPVNPPINKAGAITDLNIKLKPSLKVLPLKNSPTPLKGPSSPNKRSNRPFFFSSSFLPNRELNPCKAGPIKGIEFTEFINLSMIFREALVSLSLLSSTTSP